MKEWCLRTFHDIEKRPKERNGQEQESLFGYKEGSQREENRDRVWDVCARVTCVRLKPVTPIDRSI